MRDLGAALALVLVIEGIFPFIAPDRYRETMKALSQMSGHNLRIAAFICMLAGAVMLYLVRRFT